LGEKGLKEIGEANVRKDFIDPFFKILDWVIDDSREYDSESFVRGRGKQQWLRSLGHKLLG
jgi:hypothetical protein